jgi:hypothetical protein
MADNSMDIVGNESASATASLKEAQRGFVINGELVRDYSGHSVSRTRHTIYLRLIY